ncbi:PH domain-containing protein [Jatrophihabitans sp.]|uniref:PH domain-containing protein n=1 Tax=Jatrophihabitans sp. TaxID=1932789 RepID=UPI002EEC5B5F
MVNREVGGPALDTDQPLSWRVPPYQPALLMLVVCAVAALNIYAHPSQTVRAMTLVLGAAVLAAAVLTLRMYLGVDADGVIVRYLARPVWLPWSQLSRVEVVSAVRGSDTVRLVRHDGSYVDVPPSLLQPSAPTSKPRALARLNGIARQIETRRPRQV